MSAFLFWLISSSTATEADGSTGHLGADLGSGAGEKIIIIIIMVHSAIGKCVSVCLVQQQALIG